MRICQKCGKAVTLKELSKNYNRCQDCFQKECSDYEYWKARQLSSPDLITHRKESVKPCSNYISESDYDKRVILDFFSLRDVMYKMGITMTKFECPDCKGAVKIPDAGNITICQHCRTPIRPNEIFKKISQIK